MNKQVFVLIVAFLIVFIMALDIFNNVDGNLYAMGWWPGRRGGNLGGGTNVPEPSAIILLAGGVASVVFYRYYRNNKKQK